MGHANEESDPMHRVPTYGRGLSRRLSAVGHSIDYPASCGQVKETSQRVRPVGIVNTIAARDMPVHESRTHGGGTRNERDEG